MKFSSFLLQQHTGEWFVKHWRVQGKRILRDAGALEALTKRNVPFVDANQLVSSRFNTISSSLRENPKTAIPAEETYDTLVFRDDNVLLEGLDQAKVLTNTVEMNLDTLPRNLVKHGFEVDHNRVQSCIKNSIMFEPEQKKLPVKKDPSRPAWNFPRDYGITHERRCNGLSDRLLGMCGQIAGWRPVLGGRFVCHVEREGSEVQFNLTADRLVLAGAGRQACVTRPVEPLLPDLSPLSSLISLQPGPHSAEQHPLTRDSTHHLHLALSHYDPTRVMNLYETPVTDSQFLGRSLLKAFTFAATHAKFSFGPHVGDLPQPLLLPAVHTDSHRFHFSVLQLNTLHERGNPNLLWSFPVKHLYSECEFVDGKPSLHDYDPEVFNTLLAFYQD